MFSIFGKREKSGYTPILLDVHRTSPDNNESSIVRRTDATEAGSGKEIFHRARQIYSRGRRTSMRRSAGII